MNNLKNAVGLLNAQAPEGEFLAYINADEAKMLKDAGGAGLLTPQGIPTYFSAMYGGGAGDRGGDPRARAAEINPPQLEIEVPPKPEPVEDLPF